MKHQLLKPLFIMCSKLTGAKQFLTFLDSLHSFDKSISISLLTINGYIEKSNGYRIFYAKEFPKLVNKILNLLIPSDIGKLPDKMKLTHNPIILKEAERIIRNEPFSYIHTNSYPCSTHLIGLKLKQKYSLPWIAHFYDPWVNNTYRIFHCDYFKRIDSQIEKMIAEKADIIIHTNENIKEDWIKRYGKKISNKIFVLPFVYDDETIYAAAKRTKPINRNKKKLTISHIGNLPKQRSILPIVEAIMFLNSNFPDLKKEIIFRFIGKTALENQKIVMQNNLTDQFKFIGPLPANKLQIYYDESDILLVIDAPSDSNLFFPSKLMEYFIQKKPILGITPKNGCTYRYLKSAGHFTISNEDINGLESFFYDAIINYSSYLNFNESFFLNFSKDNVIKEYLKIVNTMLCRK